MPLPLLVALLIAAVVGGAALIAVLGWSQVEEWINSHRVPEGYAEVIGRRLANGHYRVVTGVFTRSGQMRVSNRWEAIELDAELERRLIRAEEVIRVLT